MREKILDTAYDIFCKKGYFNTTTNEIAKTAQVSIGSVYFYFKDKEAILLAVQERYNAAFMEAYNDAMQDMQQDIDDPGEWFIKLLERLIVLHRQSLEFNRELQELRKSVPQVAEMVNRHRGNIKQNLSEFMNSHREQITVHDIEAAILIALNIVNSTIDQVVFNTNDVDDQRIIRAGAEAVTKYLMG